jgi:hypothetical protein
MTIPDFRDDGLLPLGVHKATEAEVRERFGQSNLRRIDLMDRLSRWLALARIVTAQRFLVDGSFVTAKAEPNDVDCACWLPRDFEQQYEWGRLEAIQLEQSIYSGMPKELYAARSKAEWDYWVDFFSHTRKPDVSKGVVEVIL